MKRAAVFILMMLELPGLLWTKLLASDRPSITYVFVLLSALTAFLLHQVKSADGVSHLLLAYLILTLAIAITASLKPRLFLKDEAIAERLANGSGFERIQFGSQAALVVAPLSVCPLGALMLVLAAIFPSFNALAFTLKCVLVGSGMSLLGIVLQRSIRGAPGITRT